MWTVYAARAVAFCYFQMCIFVPKYIWMVDHFISHPAYKSGSYIFFVIYINVWYNIAHVVYIKNNVVFLFFKNQNALHRRKYPLLYGYSFNRFIYNAQKDLRVWLSLVTLSPWGCDKLWSLIVRRCPFYLVLHCSRGFLNSQALLVYDYT